MLGTRCELETMILRGSEEEKVMAASRLVSLSAPASKDKVLSVLTAEHIQAIRDGGFAGWKQLSEPSEGRPGPCTAARR